MTAAPIDVEINSIGRMASCVAIKIRVAPFSHLFPAAPGAPGLPGLHRHLGCTWTPPINVETHSIGRRASNVAIKIRVAPRLGWHLGCTWADASV